MPATPVPARPQAGAWIQAAGSPYNGFAYCQRFPRSSADPGQAPQHWAQVGGAQVPVGNFDSIGWSMLSVFTLFTGENWNEVMYDGMRAAGPWSAAYFVVVIVGGQIMILNLFLAVLLNKFDDQEKQTEEQGLEERHSDFAAETAAKADVAVQERQQAHDAVVRALVSWAAPINLLAACSQPGSCATPAAACMLACRPGSALVRTLDSPGSPGLPAQQPAPLAHPASAPTHARTHCSLACHPAQASGKGTNGGSSTLADLPGPAPAPMAPQPTTSQDPAQDPGTPLLLRPQPAQAAKPVDPSSWAAEAWLVHPDTGFGQRRSVSSASSADRADGPGTMEGASLGLFGAGSALRAAVYTAVHSRWFDRLVLALVLASSLALALDSPSLDPGSRLKQALGAIDLVFVGCFALEALLKILAFGFVLNGARSYLRSWWNVLDLLIVLLGFVCVVVEQTGSSSPQLAALRCAQAGAAARPPCSWGRRLPAAAPADTQTPSPLP
jgi:hypothetical protein